MILLITGVHHIRKWVISICEIPPSRSVFCGLSQAVILTSNPVLKLCLYGFFFFLGKKYFCLYLFLNENKYVHRNVKVKFWWNVCDGKNSSPLPQSSPLPRSHPPADNSDLCYLFPLRFNVLFLSNVHILVFLHLSILGIICWLPPMEEFPHYPLSCFSSPYNPNRIMIINFWLNM